MDEHFAEIVIVFITGVFSVISIIIQKRQDKLVNNIDKKTIFIGQTEAIKKKLEDISKEREMIIHKMTVLILDSNLELMKAIDDSRGSSVHSQLYVDADRLKSEFDNTTERIKELNKEYDMAAAMAKEAQAAIDKMLSKNKTDD